MRARKTAFALDSVTLRRDGTTVLDDVTIDIPAGASTALIGPSGAGKSTLLRLFTRLEEPTTGRITFHGLPLATYDVLELRRRVQLVTQHPLLLANSVADEIRLAAPHLEPAQARALIAQVGLPRSFAERITSGLSGGEAQRVCLARALALQPEMLLLDEPTSALDTESAAAIDEAIRTHVTVGGTVLLVSHNTSQVQRLADRICLMEKGRVVAAGGPNSLQHPEGTS